MGAATMIAKGILGGIGGGLQGAAKGSRTVDINDKNTNHSEAYSDLGYQVGNMGADKMKEQISSKFSSFFGKKGEKENTDIKAADASDVADAAKGLSDILLKEVYGEELDDKIIDNFARISAISFEYNDDAKEKYGEEKAVDEDRHIGVIAQELQDNPATEGTVKENENGDLEVDTRHLTFADTAAIGELSRRVLALEEAVKELQNK